jgi:AcrR family transcriptional regulator
MQPTLNVVAMSETNVQLAPERRPSTNADRFERTRRALVDSASQLFARDGYNQTNTADVVERAGVTRGALYYHFKDKSALFEAVFEDVVETMRRTIRCKAGRIVDPWKLFVTASETYLDAFTDPVFQRIALQEAIPVVGWARWQQVMSETVEADLLFAARRAMEAGYLPPGDVFPLARMLAGAFREAAFLVANAPDGRAARAAAGAAMRELLDGLHGRSPAGNKIT